MDHSVNSCGGKASSSANKDIISCPDEEESGWTSYFEDFSKSIEPSHCSSLDGGGGGGGSSLLSDAASYAAWKFSHQNNNNNSNNNNIHAVISSSSRAAPNLPKKLCFKKGIRAKQILEDDPLEDTASSPVNSPKVGDLSPSDEIISSKIDGQLDGSMGNKGSTSSEHNSDLQTEDDEHDLNFNGKSIVQCTELKKRGLCLVPLSTLVNYLG